MSAGRRPHDLVGYDLLWPRPALATTRPIWATTFNLADSGLADLGHGLADFWWPSRFWWGQTDHSRAPDPLRARSLLRGPPLPRTALRRTAQNFALFFPSPAPIYIIFSLSGDLLVFFSLSGGLLLSFSSLGVFSWNFGCPVKPRTRQPEGEKKHI